ncbi:MAG: hypothetical protein HXX09_09905 [Bacteroidetes bacterium]|nr:hypothetical protein [Bacteroidota bacterium]
MLFDYKYFIEELRNNPDKQNIIEEWEKHSKAQIIFEEPFFEYLKNFEPIPFKVPTELKKDFDWNLLLQILGATFSSDIAFVFPDLDENTEITEEMLIPELSITVNSEKQKVTKLVSELWSFQIMRLMEIFCVELIEIQTLVQTKDPEAEFIEEERKMKIKKYKYLVNEAQNYIKRNKCFISTF